MTLHLEKTERKHTRRRCNATVRSSASCEDNVSVLQCTRTESSNRRVEQLDNLVFSWQCRAYPFQSSFEYLDCFARLSLLYGVVYLCVYRDPVRRHPSLRHELSGFLRGSPAYS